MIESKEEIQHLWDRGIVMGFKNDLPMMLIVQHFLLEVEPALLILGGRNNCEIRDAHQVIQYITDLQIRRRCMDRSTPESLRFVALKGGVRAFVAARSKELFNCLSFSKNNRSEVLENINNFKWTRKNFSKPTKEKSKQYYNYKKSKGEVIIKARSLSKTHDWATVK